MADIEDFAAWPVHGTEAHGAPPAARIASLRSDLLTWYRSSRRKLPWRGDGPDGTPPVPVSPYATWVSEVMLQQTRVEAVIDHYTKWMARFPTVKDLADAPVEVCIPCRGALWGRCLRLAASLP